MSRWRPVWLVVVAVLITDCASSPLHYHTLVPAAGDAVPESSTRPYGINVERVTIPAEVDRPELVVRRNDGEVALLDNELWIAPLADEVKSAVSVEIQRRLGAAEPAVFEPALRTTSLRIEVERFESAPSRYSMIEVMWQLRSKKPDDDVILSCRSDVFERVGSGYVAMVSGHRRAIALIADGMADSMQRFAADGTAACPVD
jgi:uncharacterized lipoprotein YmbA